MVTRQICLFTLIALLTLCLQTGCNNIGESRSCTAVACHDAITVRLLPTDAYLPGTYSVTLLFSDDASISAEFGLAHVDESDPTSDIVLQVIENESYGTSWSMFPEFEAPLEIHYSGRLRSGDGAIDYAFTEEVTVNVRRDENLLFSEPISPNYTYYWCNYEYGKCDSRQNKDADVEVRFD